MNTYNQIIHKYIQAHKNEIIQELKELVRIPSVKGEAAPKAPFGEQCAEVLKYTENLYAINGFDTELYEEDGYLLSFYGKGEKSIGLFAHADVVPVSDDWLYTAAFEPIEKEGFLIGRGVGDNKAGVIISLYCAKLLKELDIPFNDRLIMFTGSNEESGMEDMKKYVAAHTPPDFSLVPDTAFPLYRGNKGMLQFTATAGTSISGIKNMVGSNVKGSVLGNLKMFFSYQEELYDFLKRNENICVTVEEDEIVINSFGISKHTALPEGSLNAGAPVFEILGGCGLLPENEREQIKFVAQLLKHYYGTSIGIENDDAEFGKLTFVNDAICFENGRLSLHFNLRFGAAVDTSDLKAKITKAFREQGFEVDFEREAPAHITDINHPLLVSCLNTYKDFTGNINAVPYVNAGGTYARYLPVAVETGTQFWKTCPFKMPAGHGGAHQPDECISIDGLLEAIELTMLMVLECDKEDIK